MGSWRRVENDEEARHREVPRASGGERDRVEEEDLCVSKCVMDYWGVDEEAFDECMKKCGW